MFKYTDNATESGKSVCNTDILNDNLMHLKYSEKTDFIVEAPNGVLNCTGVSITAPISLKVAQPKGIDENKYSINNIITLENPLSIDVLEKYTNASIFLKANKQLIIKQREETDDINIKQATKSGAYIYNSKTNFYYDENGDSVVCCELGRITSDGENIINLQPKSIYQAVDLNYIKLNLNSLYKKYTNLPPFCFNSGPVNENGDSALMELDNNILTLKSPAIGTTANGEMFTISEDVTLDIYSLGYSNFKCYYNPETYELEVYDNKVFEQTSEPQDWNTNDIWVDTSIIPNISYKKVSASEKSITKLVQTACIKQVSGEVQLINSEYNSPPIQNYIDGEWVKKVVQLYKGVIYANQYGGWSLNDYLPNDNYTYEVDVICSVDSKNSAVGAYIETSMSNLCLFRCLPNSVAGATIKVPVGTNRILKIFNSSLANDNTYVVQLAGYRKLSVKEEA